MVGPQLENQGFACSSRRVHDHVFSFPKSSDSLLLPHIGNNDLVERSEVLELFGQASHKRKIMQRTSNREERSTRPNGGLTPAEMRFGKQSLGRKRYVKLGAATKFSTLERTKRHSGAP